MSVFVRAVITTGKHFIHISMHTYLCVLFRRPRPLRPPLSPVPCEWRQVYFIFITTFGTTLCRSPWWNFCKKFASVAAACTVEHLDDLKPINIQKINVFRQSIMFFCIHFICHYCLRNVSI